jgi:choline dehydrogenase
MADYVIVGAGSAGCVLAARLSADPGNSVVLLEAGGSDACNEVRIPAAFSKLFRSPRDWAYEAEGLPSGRAQYWPRGKMLGGSSSMNAMMYVRGHQSDFDQWAALGNPGWSWREVLPYFRRCEHQERGEDAFHGVGGPLEVSDQRSPSELTRAFVDAAAGLGLPRNDDVNGASQDGVGLVQVMQRKGRRWSAADGYLRPALARPNLTVLTGAHATRVVFAGGRATGVRYRQEGQGGEGELSARREVILCGGAVGSPQLLLLSGVGPAAGLGELGIPLVADLPGVGENLQDHVIAGVASRCNRPLSLATAERLRHVASFLLLRRGPLTSNVAEGVAFVRTREGLRAPDVELLFAPTFFVEHGFDNPPGHGVSVGAMLLRPQSRGSITLRSTDPLLPPRIDPRYFSDPQGEDLATLLAGVRWARRVTRREPLASYLEGEELPGEAVQGDEELATYIRDRFQTLYHPVGTCRMGDDPLAVVDATLRVHGLAGLRVVDASVMPTLVGGHTHAPTVMIAERAADLILERAVATPASAAAVTAAALA